MTHGSRDVHRRRPIPGLEGLGWISRDHLFSAWLLTADGIPGEPVRSGDPLTHPDPLHQKLTFIKSPEHAKHMGVCEVLFQTMVWIEETTLSTGVSLPSVEAWGGDEQGGSSENEEGYGHH